MRKMLAICLLTVFTAVLAAGCAGTQTETAAEPQKNSGEFYGTWTKSDWESAGPEEKRLAVVYMIEEAAASQGSDEEVVQSIVNEAEETLTDTQYTEIEDAITAYFDNARDGAQLQNGLGDIEKTISKYVALG